MTMNRTTAIALFCASAALAQPSISTPAIGMARNLSGSVQFVTGIAGNFVLADAGIANAISAAFSGTAGFVKTNSELLVLDGSNQIVSRYDAPAGPALFAFDSNGAPALVYYSGALFRFANGNPAPLNWSGNPIAIAIGGLGSAMILDDRGGQLWKVRISLVSGAIEYEALLAGVNGPAALLPGDSIVYFDGSEIVVRDPAGTERRAAAGMAPAYLEQMGKDWIAIREAGPGRLFALRIRQQSLDLYQLPEVSQ